MSRVFEDKNGALIDCWQIYCWKHSVPNPPQAEGELEETTERQFEEIEDQMRAWSRVSIMFFKKIRYFSLSFSALI
jgi:hypothetical protein